MRGSILVAILVLVVAFAEKIRPRHCLYAAVAITAVGASWVLYLEAAGQPDELWHVAPFFGSVLITLGWVVTSEVNIRNSRRQHTIGLITQHAFDATRIANREKIKERLPSYRTKLTNDIVNFDDENDTLLKAIDLELDYYEFLAVAVKNDDVNERMLLDCLKTQFCHFHEQNKEYIGHWQKSRPSVWEHQTKMYRRWIGK